MKTNYEIRYAAHPEDAKSYDTQRIRRDFLIEKVFAADEVNMVYSMYDRMVVGGAMPVNEELKLEAIDPLKAPYFTTRREVGIFNVGQGEGTVKVGDETFTLGYKEALYIGRGDRDVFFASADPQKPAKFYFNSVTAHKEYPCKKVTKADAVVAHMGSLEMSNERDINKMLVSQVLPTSLPPAACGTPCRPTFTAAAWRLTSTSRCPRSRPCATSWGRLTRHATSG